MDIEQYSKKHDLNSFKNYDNICNIIDNRFKFLTNKINETDNKDEIIIENDILFNVIKDYIDELLHFKQKKKSYMKKYFQSEKGRLANLKANKKYIEKIKSQKST